MIAFEDIQQIKKSPHTDQSNKGYLLNNFNDTPAFITWQSLVVETQTLAIYMPDVGINIEILTTMSIKQVKAIYDFLVQLYEERLDSGQ